MANTLTASLVLDTISARVITPLGNRFAPLAAFASDFSDEQYTQGQNVRLRNATAGGTTQTNPTNWESGDSTIGNINLLVNQYSQSFQLSPRELNNGFSLKQVIDINLQNFANKVMDVAFTPCTTTNFSNITIAQSSLVYQNLQTAWAATAKSPIKNLVLDSTALSVLGPKDLYGFQLGNSKMGQGQPGFNFDGIFLNTRWTGAGTNIYGFAGGPNALAFVAGVPTMDDETKADINATAISIPLSGNGTGQASDGQSITVVASTWLARSTRIRWCSFDVMFGAAMVDNTAAILFKSA